METDLQRAGPSLPKADNFPGCLKVIHLKHKLLCFLPLRIIPIHFFTHSLTKYLLTMFYVPVTVSGARVNTHVLLFIF